MSGLGNFEQNNFEFARSGRKLETALEMLRTMEMPEPQKKIAIVGAGSVGRAVAHACVERGMRVLVVDPKVANSLNYERGKAMAFAFDPELSFLHPSPMRKMEMDFIGKVGEAGMRRPIFDFLTELHDGNAWRFTMNARESVADNGRGLNLDYLICDEWGDLKNLDNLREKKLPRKAKKAYIAKYGRVEYRKRFLR
jgi:xanthine/CO dehydrogenase XdhC/CoxF family maturation factor